MSELKNPEFWVGIGFCIVCVFLFFNLKGKIALWGKTQADNVKKDLDEAHELRVAAEALFEDYEKRTQNLDKEKAEIMLSAEREVVALQKEADDKLSKKIERKRQDVQDRISLIKENTKKDLTATMMQQVMSKTHTLLAQKNIRQSSADIDKAIDDVLNILEKRVG